MGPCNNTHTLAVVRSTLYLVGLLGIAGTWGRSVLDGTLVHLFNALHGGHDYVLPGTDDTLRTSFTGIYWPVDYLLDVLVIFFWESVDGSHVSASAIGIYFLGQLFPIAVILYISHLRHGSGSSLVTPTIWAMSFQLCTIASVGWVWTLLLVNSSPFVSPTISRNDLATASLADSRAVKLVPLALGLGYMVPSVLMGLPSPAFVSNNFQQWALVSWNIYPLITLLLLWGGLSILDRLNPPQSYHPTDKRHKVSESHSHLNAVRWVTAVTLTLSFAMHIAVLGLSAATLVFPGIFDSKFAHELNPLKLFLPPLAVDQGFTVGDGLRSFFLWDQVAGYLAILLALLVQLQNVARVNAVPFSWTKAVGLTTAVSAVAGPGSACVLLNWLRDEILFSN